MGEGVKMIKIQTILLLLGLYCSLTVEGIEGKIGLLSFILLAGVLC